jgi:hypothetical protein
MCRAELPPREEEDGAGEYGGVGREKPRREAGTSVAGAGAGLRRDASYGILAAGEVVVGPWRST